MPGMHTNHTRLILPLAFVVALTAAAFAQQPPAAPPAAGQVASARGVVPGVRNFTKADATLACGGALSPEAFAALKQAGFKSIVNLRDDSEAGADSEGEAKAAAGAGIVYLHLPFVATAPDAARLDEFLKVVVDPANQPMMLHCGSGARASMFWAVKRVMVDGWTTEKAMGELSDLSKNVAPPLKTFILDYLKAHGKTAS